MPSNVIVITSTISAIGLILNSVIFYLVITRGRETYHYLFAGIIFICGFWDLGILLVMLRNYHPAELVYYGNLINIPAMFLAPLIYHFTCDYLEISKKITIYTLWILSTISALLYISGKVGGIDGVNTFTWGNFYNLDAQARTNFLYAAPFIYFATISSCWYLHKARKVERSPVKRRHITYIFWGFVALTIASLKVSFVIGLEFPLILPAGMLLNDIFIAVIGIAIIKHQLLDITVIIKKTAIYSILGALVIFVFSFTEHLLTTYLIDIFGGHSTLTHMASAAVVIAIFLPIKHRIEHTVDGFFARKKLEF